MASPGRQPHEQDQRHDDARGRARQADALPFCKGCGQGEEQQRAQQQRKILIKEQDDRQADPLPPGDMPDEGRTQPERQADRAGQEQAARAHEAGRPAPGHAATNVRLTKIPSISTNSGKWPLLLAKKADGTKVRASSQSIIAR